MGSGEHIDKVRPAWAALGLSDIEEYANIQLVGQFRGKPVTIYAWQITGHLGNLTVDMIQPAEAQSNAYTSFLGKHGDGILSIVHEVSSRQALEEEILRMKGEGVGVLQQVTVQRDHVPLTYTYFDTEPEGKFALGLVYRPGEIPAAAGPALVSHFGAVVWDAAAVSAYWEKLGFPAFPMQHAPPRADSRYRDKPLSLAFEVGYQRHTPFRYEWISPPPSPPNIYADFLNNTIAKASSISGCRSGTWRIRKTGLPRAPIGGVGRCGEGRIRAIRRHGYRLSWRDQRGASPQLLVARTLVSAASRLVSTLLPEELEFQQVSEWSEKAPR